MKGQVLAMSLDLVAVPRSVPTPRPPTVAEARIAQLVDRIQHDDLDAFEALYRLTRDDVARTMQHLMGRRSDLEDLIQETYLQLFKAVRRFRGESRFSTFLHRVCANVALMNLRWWRRRREDVVEEPPDVECPSLNPEQSLEARKAAALVHRALEGLSAKKRIVFVYAELMDLETEEIAAIVSASPNTVRSRLHHARREFAAAVSRLTSDEVLR